MFWDHCTPPPGCIVNPIRSVGEEGKHQAIRYAQILEAAPRRATTVSSWANAWGGHFMLGFPLYLASLRQWFENLWKIRANVERFSASPAFQTAIADTIVCLQRMYADASPIASFSCTEVY